MSSSPTISSPARLTKNGRVQIAYADEVGAVFDERDEPLALGLGQLAVGDVAHDLRRADDLACVIFDGRHRERHLNALAVGSQALGLEMVDSPPGFQGWR